MSLEFSIYNVNGEYTARFKNDFDAAFFVAGQPDGTTIRIGPRQKDTVWTEGLEDDSAARSYSATVEKIQQRMKSKRKGSKS